ncbi:unnamed protein product [Paramecium primaurelia]|uniref:Peptidase C39-like domain-containing protein n=1 Tax=Paramecium primaurelia TaxID=5886 RepID=A0A8S1LRT2_PARPR|nr:unnamed protein product [Paramecium primaurelia]
MKQVISVLLIIAIAHARSYTLYKQCDATWGKDQLGTSSNTICSAGCLISSVAMMLHTYGVTTDGTTTPRTMNTWLKKNGGYASGDLFVWASIDKLGFHYQGKFTAAQAKTKFDAGQHIILCVNSGGHYVLMTSYSGDTFNVNDPGYSKTSYPASGITNAAAYTYSKITFFKNHVLNLE